MHPRDAQRTLVEQAKRLLEARPTARLPVAEISRRLGCSVFHLCRAFRRSEGRTISAYRGELRLRLALRRLCAAPESDLTQLALDCGYCSHSHFTYSFRRHLGITPSAFAGTIRRDRGRAAMASARYPVEVAAGCGRSAGPLAPTCARGAQ